MSIFGNIVSKLFGHSTAHAAPAAGSAAAPAAAPAGTPAAPSPAGSPAPASTSATPTSAAATSAAPAAAGAAPSAAAALHAVDVTAILDDLVAKHGQKLDWRHSIVDLLKALDLDSSLTARKELASELHYTGSTDDSATMNVWLIKQVIAKLAENGGKLPADLVH
jgi:hypothetical protein